MSILLPKDDNGIAIPAMRFGAAHTITVGLASGRNLSAFTARVIKIRADTDCFVKTGDVAVAATTSDHFLPANETQIVSVGQGMDAIETHIAAIQKSAGGTLYISELI